MTIFEQCGAFLAGARRAGMSALPGGVVEVAKDCLADTVAVMISGAANQESAQIAARHAIAQGARPEAALVAGGSSSPALAALANSTAAHAEDFDDACPGIVGGHVSAVVIPTALALSQARELSATEIIVAIACGFEVEFALARGVNPWHYEAGYHPTSTLGTFGATAAAALLLELNAKQSAHALAIAASMASGIKANFGTMTKPFHCGWAAHAGVTAAQLARAGLNAAPDAFEARMGFAEVYGGPDYVLEPLQLAPETDWALAGPIVTRKAWPCCGSMHSSIDAVLQLKRDHGIGPDDVRTIVSRVPSRRFPHIDRPRPSSGLEARFSAQYGIVVALRHGDVTVAAFDDLQPNDPYNLELLKRVELKADPQLGSDDPDMRGSRDMGAVVEAVLFDGRRLSVTVDFPLGNPHNPLTSQALRKKFLQCAATSLEPAECEALWGALGTFEQGEAGVAQNLLRLIATGSSKETPSRGGDLHRANSLDAPD